MQVLNDGQHILSTDYWLTPHARRGLLWLTWSARALRVLVPPTAEQLLHELPPPGTPAIYIQRQTARIILYEDDPVHPYVLEVDARQCDRTLPRSDDGRVSRLLWYGRHGEEGVRLLREERITVRVESPPVRGDQPVALLTLTCALQVFRLDAAGAPVPIPADLYQEILELLARDPVAEWVPQPTGKYTPAARAARPTGTASWHCMLAAPSSADAMVRLLWAGDSLAQALQSLESTFWHAVPRRFVFAALVAARLGRTCRGAEGPIAASVVPWSTDAPPPQPPPPLSRRRLQEMATECLQALLRQTAIPVPERGTDAYRFLVQLGGLVWREDNTRWLAQVYNGATESPAVLVHAVGLHAFLHHPLQVTVSDATVRAADLRASEELWAQWAEWLLCDVPPEFLRWAYPDSLYRVSDMLEPREQDVPDPETASRVERALLLDAEQNARYVPYGAFSLHVPEEVFLSRWGVRYLWLWVDGKRAWCAVAGEDGLPRESFCWEAGRGVLSNMVVPLPVAPALSAVLVAVWRDMVVAGEEAIPARQKSEAVPRHRAGTKPGPRSWVEQPTVFPRRRTLPARISGPRLWGTEEDRASARRAHYVRGHLRRLPAGRSNSTGARAAAEEHGIIVPPEYTFVRPHVRGHAGQSESAAQSATRAVARGLRTLAILLKPGAARPPTHG